MTSDEVSALVAGIRERRTKIGESIARLKKTSATLSIGQVTDKLDAEFSKFKTELEAIDKKLGKLEKRLSNIHALKLQLDDAT